MSNSDRKNCCSSKNNGRAKEYRDPVCGMVTTDPDAYIRYEYEGETYYFCSPHCLKKFKENPRAYAGKQDQARTKPAAQEAAPGTGYWCPMCPAPYPPWWPAPAPSRRSIPTR